MHSDTQTQSNYSSTKHQLGSTVHNTVKSYNNPRINRIKVPKKFYKHNDLEK